MHFTTIFTLAAVVASTSADLLARQAPACADTCIASANLNGCVATDTLCLCKNQAFLSSTTACINSSCTGSDLAAAYTFAEALCAAVGVTLSSTATAATSTSPTSGTSPTSSGTSHISSSTSPTSSSTSAPATSSKAAAATHGANTFVGLAAVGLVALAL